MGRILIEIALPLIIPFALYVMWLKYAQKRAERFGDEPPAFTRGTAFISILIGVVLVVAVMIVMALSGGRSPTDGQYLAPRFENGKIVGPTYEKKPPVDTGNEYRP